MIGRLSERGSLSAEIGSRGRLYATLNSNGQLSAELSKAKVRTLVDQDYTKLDNKPTINGVELNGNSSFEDLGENTITNSELKSIIDSQFDVIFGG